MSEATKAQFSGGPMNGVILIIDDCHPEYMFPIATNLSLSPPPEDASAEPVEIKRAVYIRTGRFMPDNTYLYEFRGIFT